MFDHEGVKEGGKLALLGKFTSPFPKFCFCGNWYITLQ